MWSLQSCGPDRRIEECARPGVSNEQELENTETEKSRLQLIPAKSRFTLYCFCRLSSKGKKIEANRHSLSAGYVCQLLKQARFCLEQYLAGLTSGPVIDSKSGAVIFHPYSIHYLFFVFTREQTD